MTRRQVLLGILVIVILVAFGVYYVTYMQAPAPQQQSTIPTASTAEKSTPVPPIAQPAVNASNYIVTNIAKLSGLNIASSTRLLVSRINFGNGTGTVEFSDGKKTYTADFDFSASATNTAVTNFKLRK